jgi:hypothetical protein
LILKSKIHVSATKSAGTHCFSMLTPIDPPKLTYAAPSLSSPPAD